MPRQRSEEERRRDTATTAAAAAAAAVAVAPVVAGAAAAPAAFGVVPAEQVASASAAVIASSIAFLAAAGPRDRQFLDNALRVRSTNEADIAQALALEDEYGAEFVRKTQERLRAHLPPAFAIPDPVERERVVRAIIEREKRYQRMRIEAMTIRALSTVERLRLRRESPQGAYWKSSATVIEHCAACLLMSGGGRGRGRFWPWVVLDLIHPPHHHGCPCSLHSYGEAIRRGWLRAGDVMDEREARKAAAPALGMIPGEPPVDPKLTEALIAAGLTTPERLAAAATPEAG